MVRYHITYKDELFATIMAYFLLTPVHCGLAMALAPCLHYSGTKAFSAASFWNSTSYYVILEERKGM